MKNPSGYHSPFSWRYSTENMRQVWGEENKHLLWRKMWAALARVQSHFGIVTSAQVADIQAHILDIDLVKSAEIESEIHHDLMAELKIFARQCEIGGPVLHLGATSMDIEDNAEALRLRAALDLVTSDLKILLGVLADQIDQWAELPVIGFTHLQAAEPTTLGYRLAFTAQDLLNEYAEGKHLRACLRGKGFKGAVGTGAAFSDLLGLENLEAFEQLLSQEIDLSFYEVTNQTSPRLQEYHIIAWLAAMAGSLHKFAFDLRILQSPAAGEMMEAFSPRQVGSSAMPFKRNPISAEKIDSLARFLAQMPRIAWDNYANSLLERTLDDSANRRLLLPEAFLAADEIIHASIQLVSQMVVDENAASRNLEKYAPFAATERILLALTRQGADRLTAHERLRQMSLQAWQVVQAGEANPLVDLIKADETISNLLTEDDLLPLLDVKSYTGMAPQRSHQLAKRIRTELNL